MILNSLHGEFPACTDLQSRYNHYQDVFPSQCKLPVLFATYDSERLTWVPEELCAAQRLASLTALIKIKILHNSLYPIKTQGQLHGMVRFRWWNSPIHKQNMDEFHRLGLFADYYNKRWRTKCWRTNIYVRKKTRQASAVHSRQHRGNQTIFINIHFTFILNHLHLACEEWKYHLGAEMLEMPDFLSMLTWKPQWVQWRLF